MTNVVNGAPAFLAPDWRFAGDDWSGANALTYIVYATAPVYASDGVTIVTAGIPRDLTGCTVSGILQYQSRCAPAPAPAPASLPIPTGAISGAPTGGIITLSLTKTQTIFPRQDFATWGDPRRALLRVQPQIIDANGEVVTVGLQPLFVF